MMWEIMSSAGGSVSLSAPSADDAARLYALTHGLLAPARPASVSSQGVLYEMGNGVTICVSRVSKGPSMDDVRRAAVDLHDKLKLPEDDDESMDLIQGVLERMAGNPEETNCN